MKNELAHNIKAQMHAHGYTVLACAHDMGITQGALSLQINGNPTIATLTKIATTIGCQVRDFFPAPEEKENTQHTHTTTGTCPHCGNTIHIALMK